MITKMYDVVANSTNLYSKYTILYFLWVTVIIKRHLPKVGSLATAFDVQRYTIDYVA